MSIGSRIAEARRDRGLSQTHLAQVIDRNVSAISRLESDERKLSSFELGLIAEALGVTMRWILGIEEAPPSMALAARVEEAMASHDAHSALSRVRETLEVEAILEQVGVDVPTREVVTIPSHGETPIATGEQMAVDARAAVGLGDGPLGDDLPGVLENRFGVDVLLLPLPGGFLGACVLAGERAIVVANSEDRRGRRRFTLAHELGHHIFGDPDEIFLEDSDRMLDRTNTTEVRASAFAAHFIAPRSWLRRRAADHQITAELVLEIALEAGLSYQATVFHLHNCDLLDSAAHRDELTVRRPHDVALTSGRLADWTDSQSAFVGERPATFVVRRAQDAYRRGMIGIRPLADVMFRNDPEVLRQELDEGGMAPHFA